ncbi:MAG TPA: hypothetical protein QGG59_10550 [Planctomycetota bacterium]|jgi:tetratricopeptide (TPR) repeat protein|nr:hypothetical protein [Planctomycetota bacterium]MDP7246334.1 hypothetical protein [Planctomycetota bacterium]HJM40539.1 hypothetical protein [Planctomycetota bacterium]
MTLLCAFFLATPMALPQEDTLTLIDGKLVSGKITEATLEKVQVNKPNGDKKEYSSQSILFARFGSLSSGMNKGEEFLSKFDFANAVASFSSEESQGHRLEYWARLRKAETLSIWGKIDLGQSRKAESAFRDWLARYPDNFFVPRARQGLAFAMARNGQVDEAAKELEAVAALAFDKSLPPHVEIQARLARCEVRLLHGQPGVAKTRLEDIVTKIENATQDRSTSSALKSHLERMKSQAQVALGDSIELKDGMAASQRYWENLLSKANLSMEVRAAATIGLARAANSSGQARESQILLAKVVATMPASPKVTSKALWFLAEISAELGDSPIPSKTYYQRLVDDYPFSSWGILAQKRLSG